MLREQRIGNLVLDTKFGRKWSDGETSSRLKRETLTFPVVSENDTVAFLSISSLCTEFWDREAVQPHSPIKIELTQFKTVEIQGGKLETQTQKDIYFLGRKHFGENYGGKLWLHIGISEGQEPAVDDSIGDLVRYRNAVECALDQVPGGSNQWYGIDDVLSFIDGMNK